MTAPPAPLYRCTVCEVDWTYEAVRHIACCRACGGSLLVRRSDTAPASPAAGRRFSRRRARVARPLPAR
jgi:hypothetical protein